MIYSAIEWAAISFWEILPVTSFFVVVGLLAAALAIRLQKDIALMLPVSGMLLLLLGYVLGLSGMLVAYAPIVLLAAGLCAAYLLVRFLRASDRSSFSRYLLTYGMLAFCAWFFLILFINMGRELVEWDDFSFWAIAVKDMVRLDHLYVSPDAAITIAGWIPPASPLIIYLANKLAGGFSEPISFAALQTFCVLFVIPIFALLKRKTSYILVIFALCVFPLASYLLPIDDPKYLFNSLYADTTIGVVYGFGLILLLFDAFRVRYQKLYYPILFLIGFVLCATKQAGLFFVVALVGIAAVQLILDRRNWTQYAKSILAFCMGWLTATTSWTWYLSQYPAVIEGSRGAHEMPISVLTEFFVGQGTPLQYQTVLNFAHYVFTREVLVNLPMSFSLLCCMWAIIMIGIDRYHKAHKARTDLSPRLWKMIALTMMGVTVNLICLLLAYVFSFSEREAAYLASMSRYLYPLILSLAMVGLAFFISRNKALPSQVATHRHKKLRSIARVMACLLVIAISSLPMLLYIRTHYRVDYRNQYFDEYPGVTSADVTGKRVFLVAQDDGGMLYFRTSYYLNPVHLNPYATWHVSEECITQDDPITPRISLAEWQRMLIQGEYDYVYLMEIDDDFIADYGGGGGVFLTPQKISPRKNFFVGALGGFLGVWGGRKSLCPV
ncbi:MAG: hypothetical protein FWG78_03105, partial [Coriobacteriia bacterium]|nr:hypothetical protein [Coriobacteriia bacterium]